MTKLVIVNHNLESILRRSLLEIEIEIARNELKGQELVEKLGIFDNIYTPLIIFAIFWIIGILVGFITLYGPKRFRTSRPGRRSELTINEIESTNAVYSDQRKSSLSELKCVMAI